MSLILIVDDEPGVRRSVRRLLERAGHEILEAGNGAEALSLLEQKTLDLMITDLHMPDFNGIELMNAVRKSGKPRPRIVAFSGSAEGPILDMALALGADAILAKPFSNADLLDAIARAQKKT